MEEKDRNLLFKILCAMLPYGVIVETQLTNAPRPKYPVLRTLKSNMLSDFKQSIKNVVYKPYLRPLSSMTKEELHEIQEILGKGIEVHDNFIEIIDSNINTLSYLEMQALFDWFNKNKFDYLGLIPKMLALPASEEMYK